MLSIVLMISCSSVHLDLVYNELCVLAWGSRDMEVEHRIFAVFVFAFIRRRSDIGPHIGSGFVPVFWVARLNDAGLDSSHVGIGPAL
jgi:hypothetical protein